MKCNSTQKVFDYINSEFDSLDVSQKTAFETHFSSCPDCQSTLNFIKSLKDIKPITASQNMVSKIMDLVEDSKTSTLFSHTPHFYIHSLAVPLILAFIIIGVLFTFSPRNSAMAKVKFAINLSNANSVCLAGDFNGWNPSQGQLKLYGKIWKGTFTIPPGRYQYMLIIDGNKWMPDPNAKEYVNDGYGNKNSVIDTAKI